MVRTAARVALGFAAWASARDLAARALELSEEEGLGRARRLHLLGEATASAVGVDEALPLLEESLDVYRAAGADAAREGIVDAACSLGRLLRAQTQFALTEQLADRLLLELGEREDVATAKLLSLRGIAVLSAWDDFDRARGDAERALTLARHAGDPDAELEALQLLTNCTEEGDELERQRWVEIESLARARGRWELAVGAVRAQASVFIDEPERTLSELERSGELAEARGLVDEAAWVDYGRTEAHLAAGSWDDAIAVGLRAVEAAEARNVFRIAVRTWFALRPIAQARGRADLVERAFSVFEGIRGSSDSPYARVMVTAMDLAFAEAGLMPSFVPELEPRLASFDLGYGDPSWLAALEAIVDSWLAAGAPAEARIALERLRASSEGKHVSKLALASHALMWSRLLLAEGDVRPPPPRPSGRWRPGRRGGGRERCARSRRRAPLRTTRSPRRRRSSARSGSSPPNRLRAVPWDVLNDEQRELRDLVRQLARERIAPRAAEIDSSHEFPWDVVELFRENDIFGLFFAEEHGGLGTGTLLSLVAIEEVGKVCATSALILAVQELGSLGLKLAGSDEQKERYLPRFASGEWLPRTR